MYPLGHGSGEKGIYCESDEAIFICASTLSPLDSVNVHWVWRYPERFSSSLQQQGRDLSPILCFLLTVLQQSCSPSSKIILFFKAQHNRPDSGMFPFLFTPLEFSSWVIRLQYNFNVESFVGTFCFLLTSEKKRYIQRGKKVSHGWEDSFDQGVTSLPGKQPKKSWEMWPFPSALPLLCPACCPARQRPPRTPRPGALWGQDLLHAARSGCLAPTEGEDTDRNDAHDFGEQPFPLTSPQGHAGHGGEEGDGDAMFQMRRNRLWSERESLKVMMQHLRCAFSFQSAVAALALLPLPYLQALPVLLMPY